MCWIISGLIWTVLVYSDFPSLAHMYIETITDPDFENQSTSTQDFGMLLLLRETRIVICLTTELCMNKGGKRREEINEKKKKKRMFKQTRKKKPSYVYRIYRSGRQSSAYFFSNHFMSNMHTEFY